MLAPAPQLVLHGTGQIPKTTRLHASIPFFNGLQELSGEGLLTILSRRTQTPHQPWKFYTATAVLL